MFLVLVLVIIRQLFWEILNLMTKRVPFQRKEIVMIKSNNEHADTHPISMDASVKVELVCYPTRLPRQKGPYSVCNFTSGKHIQLHIDDTFKHKILLGCIRCLNVQSILPC